MMCRECYSKYSRITPLKRPKECLKNHRQYICQTCGRCICANRGLFPFKTLEMAKLYLRPVEAIKGKPCGIYEVEAFYSKMSKDQKVRKTYKILADKQELEVYLKKSTNKKAVSDRPKFAAIEYIQCSEKQLRKLTSTEIELYLKEKENQAETWSDFIEQYIS